MTATDVLSFPFVVHTATYGYAWSSVPDGLSRAELDAVYRRAAALKPEFMSVGDTVAGVLAQGGRVIAFRFQVAPGWDANGRNAAYDAFAFLPSSDAWRVDFRALLDDAVFRVPSRNPPACVRAPCVAGLASVRVQATAAALCSHELLSNFDFREVGPVLAAGDAQCDRWQFVRIETRAGVKMLASAEPRSKGVRPCVTLCSSRSQSDVRPVNWLNFFVWAVAVLAVVGALSIAWKS